MSRYEVILKSALEMYMEEMLIQLPSDEELADKHIFSEKFNKRKSKLINRQKKAYYNLINTAAKRAAVIFITLFISLSMLMGVKATRDAVLDFIITVYEKFSVISFNKKSPSYMPIPKIEEYYEPSYLPEGYELKNRRISDLHIFCEYRNAEGDDLTFSQDVFENMGMKVDAEGVKYETIQIGSREGIYYFKHGYSNIIWSDGVSYLFDLSAKLDKNELLKVAESVTSDK